MTATLPKKNRKFESNNRGKSHTHKIVNTSTLKKLSRG